MQWISPLNHALDGDLVWRTIFPWNVYPSELSDEDTSRADESNSDHLLDRLPNLEKALDSPEVQSHPLSQCRGNNAAMSICGNQCFAEELWGIDTVPGIHQAIRQLLSSELREPTLHVETLGLCSAAGKGKTFFWPKQARAVFLLVSIRC